MSAKDRVEKTGVMKIAVPFKPRDANEHDQPKKIGVYVPVEYILGDDGSPYRFTFEEHPINVRKDDRVRFETPAKQTGKNRWAYNIRKR